MFVPIIIQGGLGSSPPVDAEEHLRDDAALKGEFFARYGDREITSGVEKWDRAALAGMFETMGLPDTSAPGGQRPATTFELLSPDLGRGLVLQLLRSERWKRYKRRTKVKNLGLLRRYVRFVIDDPFLPGFCRRESIHVKYGPIFSPIRDDDFPKLGEQQPEEGAVLTREQLWALYDFLYEYVRKNPGELEIATSAAMIFVAAESGLRISELVMLDVIGNVDVLFDTHELRTRHGKRARGTGKRTRRTILTPHAEAVVKWMLKEVRPRRPGHDRVEALFLQPDGRRMSIQMARYWLGRVLELAEKAGVALPKNITFHSFRRTFATLFAEDGPHRISDLMWLLGHRNFTTLPRYVLHSHEWQAKKIKEVYLERCPA